MDKEIDHDGFYYANEGNQENLICQCPCGCNGENTPGDGFPVNPKTMRCFCCESGTLHKVSPFDLDLIRQVKELRQVADFLEKALSKRQTSTFQSNAHWILKHYLYS